MPTAVSEEKKPMRAIEIGRRMLELGHPKEACQAFTLFLLSDEEQNALPQERMEAAASLIQYGEEYTAAYDAFLTLYREGYFREDILSILTEGFYQPNVREIRNRYERNVKQLRRYPYLFRADFPAFDELPLVFFPCDDDTYAPLDTRTGDFLPVYRPRFERITRNFFHDLENPVFASDVYSQYELEYLRDNVRRSEDVGRENHLYLHYSDWTVFCSYLTVLNVRPLLKDQKIVFLMEEERAQYPIDFKARFGIDYSQFPLKPVGIREVTRLIWHTQLSAHNGGDFFNEIFDFHPNLITVPSIFMSAFEEEVATLREALRVVRSLKDLQEQIYDHWDNPALVSEIYHMKNPTDKDLLVTIYLGQKDWNKNRDPASRIAPAVFFQPHFRLITYTMSIRGNNTAELHSDELTPILKSPMLCGFPYIKTFTPLRRFTTSCGGALRFAINRLQYLFEEAKQDRWHESFQELERTKENWYSDWDARMDRARTLFQSEDMPKIPDFVSLWCLGRSFMIDPEDRLFRDSRVVRFEDGKLNPKATFTRLAAFLDLPYTETMTYCSEYGEKDPHADNPVYNPGFDTRSVYTDHGQYIDDGSRKRIEFFLQDAYRFYGYDTQYYHGETVDEAVLEQWYQEAETVRSLYERVHDLDYQMYCMRLGFDPLTEDERRELDQLCLKRTFDESLRVTHGLLDLGTPRMVNHNGLPMSFCPLLEPDPDLLEQPLYH